MSDTILDDSLKQAQIRKTEIETQKLEAEIKNLGKQARNNAWVEPIKLIGGVVLGLGGAVAAYTQYEVAEMRVKNANTELKVAEDGLKRLKDEQATAEVATKAAQTARDKALKEQKVLEEAVKSYKVSLAQTDSRLREVKPATGSRLAYIQFRGELSRDLINELRANLAEKSFNAPGAERIAGEYQNMVKYFKPSDSTAAKQLAEAVESFFQAKGCPLQLHLTPATSTTVQNPPLEVWLAHKCSA
jgi:hypothetical protein